ncbi:MAG: hypothetical protein RBR41_04940 [Desulfovibrio sp.]|uniref:hypothetical protein n=1 Tax=Desulfovibrio sp. TaxID=885 RepID=UPI002A3685D4|nr:hypothetical protein [Desulfovibrio sp.]MDY0258996.1 hypothetical protein [Desulfovibrio sp.]
MRENSSIVLLPEHIDCPVKGKNALGGAAGGQLEHLTLEMLAYGRQKPAYPHFVARIFRKILAELVTHFIRKLL